MGHKVRPTGLRLGITETWRSRWYATNKNFGKYLVEDVKMRRYIKSEFGFAGISRIDIERIGDKVKVIIHAARPGLIIGKKGAKVDLLTDSLSSIVRRSIELDIKEIANPEMVAQLVAEAITEQLEKRAPYRRTMRRYSEMVMESGALGVKLMCAGRLGGAEIARTEKLAIGKIPLSTLRANIDYGSAVAVITKGTIGVKVWIFKGEILEKTKEKPHVNDAQESQVPKVPAGNA